MNDRRIALSVAGSQPLQRLALVLWVAAIAATAAAVHPTPVVAWSCPTLPLSVADFVSLESTPGPLAKRFALGVTPMNERALACYGSRELRFTAFVNEPGGIGGTTSFAIRPSWLVGGGLIVFGSSREVAPGYGDGPFFMFSIRPSAGDLQHRYARQWVSISGHLDDPAAATCRATGPAGVTPTRAQAIAICRTMFVLTSIRPTGAPDTSTASATVAPDPQRAPTWWLGGLAGLLAAVHLLRRRSVPVGR